MKSNSFFALSYVIIFKFCAFLFLLYENLPAQIPRPDHIVIVIEENYDYDQIMENRDAIYIKALAKDDHGAVTDGPVWSFTTK